VSDLPPLDTLGPDDFDMTRVPTILASALARGDDDDLYRQYLRGELLGRFALGPFDPETGCAGVDLDDRPFVAIHYGCLWKGAPLNLVGGDQ